MSRRHLRVLASPAFENEELNPYNRLLYEHLAPLDVLAEDWSRERVWSAQYDLAHLHWPDLRLQEDRWTKALRNAVGTVASLVYLRQRRVKIIWTAHNHRSHEHFYPRLERWYWWSLTRLLDGHISLSQSAQADLLQRFSALAERPGAVVAHGNYRAAYPRGIAAAAAKQQLGFDPDAIVLCFIGRIRPYKNVAALVRAFRRLEGRQLRLLIAGEPEPSEIMGEIERAASDDSRIVLRPGFIPDEQIPTVLAASDLLVLPYREVMNSGTALLGLSYERPVLAPRLGSLVDLQLQVGVQHVRTYTGEMTPSVLSDALDWLSVREQDTPNLTGTSWGEVAAATREFYDAVVDSAPRRPSTGNYDRRRWTSNR